MMSILKFSEHHTVGNGDSPLEGQGATVMKSVYIFNFLQ